MIYDLNVPGKWTFGEQKLKIQLRTVGGGVWIFAPRDRINELPPSFWSGPLNQIFQRWAIIKDRQEFEDKKKSAARVRFTQTAKTNGWAILTQSISRRTFDFKAQYAAQPVAMTGRYHLDFLLYATNQVICFIGYKREERKVY